MKIGKLHIAWVKPDRRDWQAKVDDLLAEQNYHKAKLAALSKRHLDMLSQPGNWARW